MSASQFPVPAAIMGTINQGSHLLDRVTLSYGPKRRLGRFFLIADAMARRIGCHIRIHEDASTLVKVNSYLQESWGPLGPMFDPDQSDISPQTAFWISVQNEEGNLVAAYATRFYQIGAAGLADELRSLRVHYANPGPHIANGVQCLVEDEAAAAAELIVGRVSYGGAVWVTPQYRAAGLPYLLTRIGRHIAITQWDTEYAFTLLRADLASKGILIKYGVKHQCPTVRFINSYRGDFKTSLVWMDRAWMETELGEYVRDNDQNTTLGTDSAETTISPRESHGSKSLS